MISFSKVALSSVRLAARVWPFRFGNALPTRIAAYATKIGLLHSEWYEFQPGLWMQLNARDLIQQTILLEGVWDPSLTSFIEGHLRPDDVFIDVGAHVGYFTLLASRRVGPAGAVLSIEPNPFALAQLRQNVARSHTVNVLVERSACGESLRVVRLYLHTESNSSMASLSTANATGGVAVDVPCTTLDQLCQEHALARVDLVKIDVEGAELSVLRGMKRIMKDIRPVIVLELEPHLLEAFGTPLQTVLTLLADCDYILSPLGGHSNYVCRPRAGSCAR
jgi:FkbM family methyltransferase